MMAGRRPAVAFFLALLATATALQPPKTMSVRCAGNEPREITLTPRAEAGTLSRRWLQTMRCPHRPRAPVASVTWGASRRFTLKPRKKVPASLEADAADPVALELYLGDGDLLVMGGACQQTHVHGVPKRRKKDEGAPGRRISWTFRQFRAPGEVRKRKR